MIAELREIETFVKKETRLQSVFLIVENEGPGIRVLIDHESTTHTTGNFIEQDIPVIITLRDVKANWESVAKNAWIIQAEFRSQKSHKYSVGDIERIEDESEYVLRLRVSVKIPAA